MKVEKFLEIFDDLQFSSSDIIFIIEQYHYQTKDLISWKESNALVPNDLAEYVYRIHSIFVENFLSLIDERIDSDSNRVELIEYPAEDDFLKSEISPTFNRCYRLYHNFLSYAASRLENAGIEYRKVRFSEEDDFTKFVKMRLHHRLSLAKANHIAEKRRQKQENSDALWGKAKIDIINANKTSKNVTFNS